MHRDTLTADMKTAIKTTVAELLSVLVTRTLESDGGSSLAIRLRILSSESFVQLLGAIFKIVLVMYAQAIPITPSVAC
ncbi:Vacuolar protein sorting-associated protein 54 chloroplastic [Bienertia sinuspersici]